MPDLSHWFLTSVLSPLLLPVFMLMLLCMIAGARPESITLAFISMIGTLITGFFQMLVALVRAITPQRRYPPNKYPPTKYPPRN